MHLCFQSKIFFQFINTSNCQDQMCITSMYLCRVWLLLLQLSSQHTESLLQQRGHPHLQALPLSLSVQLLSQGAVETQDVLVTLILLLVSLLDSFPQQRQLLLDTFKTLQVHTRDGHRRKDGLRNKRGVSPKSASNFSWLYWSEE